jgi:hypothetical protein
MSLFIPRVFLNITANRIKNCVEDFGLGEVERVDLVLKGNYNAAYIHFKIWNNTSFTAGFQYRASNPNKKCILEYDTPWYWIVLENTSAKRVGPEMRKEVINIRPDFMEPLELASGLPDELTNSATAAADRTVPYSVLEDVMWDMEVMQGEINELRSVLEQSGFKFPESENQENYPEPAETVVDELQMEIQNMQYEIDELRNAIYSEEKIVTCAITGNKFREVLRVDYEPVEEELDLTKSGLTRSVATCDIPCELRRSEAKTYNIESEFWEEWEPVEVQSEEFPDMCNQMFKNKVTGVISDLGDLLELGLSKGPTQIEVEF